MADRKIYHVNKTEEGWEGKLEGGQRASVTGSTKEEVVSKTIDLAKNQEKSSVIIHTKDGKIEEERTFPRASDPKTKG
ncbi:hypothetical protein TH63_09285 [Rufibacter radiotolerans]|uniref:DUF2188 domain-containing protein n=1 Tax=Rufibacter radiotolerans TaxID=1379910 RepID=A0A0H4VPC9_9BACT|nr:DUF2188 domain-containing protein [Rufibacter radiotolerans]AKQ45792.1 hypothetical protein TH63_09285 [Rufibacter radiotolerans]